MKVFDRALVTGASSGLGRALCQLLDSKNIPLMITGRDEKNLQETAALLKGGDLIVESLDLSKPLQRKKLIELIQRYSPNLVINNAGFGLYGDLLEHSTEESLNILEVNAKAPLEISIEAARQMIHQGKKGIILNVSSAAAFFSFPTMSVYAASKAFINNFSEAFDVEISSKQLRVLVACPGQIATFFRKVASRGYPQKKDHHTMSAEKAAQEIWKQIEREIPIHVFDSRYRILIALSHLIPRRLLHLILRHSIHERFVKDIL